MVHTLMWAVVGLLLAAWTFRASGGKGASVPLWLALPWTLWLAEGGFSLITPPPVHARGGPSGGPTVTWRGRQLGADTLRPATDQPRVLVVGDSFVSGIGVDETETLPRQMQDRMTAAGSPAEVLNCGDAGRSFYAEYVAYDALGTSLGGDVVVWVFVLNDFGFRGSDDFDLINLAPPPASTGVAVVDVVRRGLWARETTSLTTEGYQAALGPKVAGMEQLRLLVGAMADELHARGGRFVFTVYPLMHALDAYPFDAEHDRLNAIAAEAGAEVVDLRPVFRGRDASSLWSSDLDHHPNRAAHGMAADVLTAALLAAPIVQTGPMDCAALPPIADLGDALTQACRGAPADQVALAAKLLRTGQKAPYLPLYAPSVAGEVAGHAGVFAERAGDAAVAELAAEIVAETRPVDHEGG